MSSAPEVRTGPEPFAHRAAAIAHGAAVIAQRPAAMRRRLDLTATLGFCVLIALPTVDQLVRPASARDARLENREPEAMPPAPQSLSEAARWPSRFEKHHADTFGTRDVLLGVRNDVLLRAQLSPNAILDVGPTGWIFYRGDEEFHTHRGVRTPTGAEMDRWILALQDRKDRLARRGARFLFAIAPDKETIYPEKQPDTWRPIGPTMADRFLAEVAARTDVEVVDLRPALRAEKAFDRPEDEDFVYYPRGSHWTPRGALAATNAILDAFRRTSPSVSSLDRSAYVRIPVEAEYEDSWAGQIYTPWRLRPSFNLDPTPGWAVDVVDVPTLTSLAIAHNPDTTLPSVYFLHDSFGTFVYPFLLQRTRFLRAEWHSYVNEPAVELDRPEIVLMLKSERMLVYPPEKDIRASGSNVRRELGLETLRWSLRGANPPPTVLGNAELGADGTWTTSSWSDRLEVETGGVLGEEELGVVHVDIVAPQDGVLELWSSEVGRPGWSKHRRTRVGLVQGRNDRMITLPFEGHAGRLLLRVAPAGKWRFRAFEFHVFQR